MPSQPPLPNRVLLTGKVSRVGSLKYTPSGEAVCEFTLAVQQRYFDTESMGYFEALVLGRQAEEASTWLRVGRRLDVQGSLWSRAFRNRQGTKVQETKIVVDLIADLIGGPNEKK